ncbi:hypothetical protein JZ751_011862 [Albula glossodonta]|uniref:Uncharacterized protein n=1 Tax=Albula glossodonta TaxID=121402 RepID=A0A8T2PQU7_9TELE|nr:hypothetical protein JZ751_011862 [Albula glossodonta]
MSSSRTGNGVVAGGQKTKLNDRNTKTLIIPGAHPSVLAVGACAAGKELYLADQCWNGGCIYLIMLRRIKRKAPLPPCNGSTNGGGSGSGSGSGVSSGDLRIGAPSEPKGSPAQNGKRTRKFGVITRTSFTSDSKESGAGDSEQENGYCVPMEAEATPTLASIPTDTPMEVEPVTVPPITVQPHEQNGGFPVAPPTRPCIRLNEGCKSESLNSELSYQVSPYLPCH